MSRYWYLLLFVIIMFSACRREHKVTESADLESYPQQYKELNIPYISLRVTKGDTVLVPKKKFLDAFLSGKNNFFWFQPRVIDSVGKYSVYVWEIDSLVEVPNAFVVSFPHKCDVKEGDYVFTWWQEGSGLQRAFVLSILDDNRIVVRYLDLDIFTAKGKDNVIDTIMQGSFRVIRGDYDPGASVRFITSKGKDFYVIINHNDSAVVCRSTLGKIRFFRTNEVEVNGLRKNLTVGEDVELPFYGIYIPGKVVSLRPGYVDVQARIIDHIDTMSIPYLDVFAL